MKTQFLFFSLILLLVSCHEKPTQVICKPVVDSSQLLSGNTNSDGKVQSIEGMDNNHRVYKNNIVLNLEITNVQQFKGEIWKANTSSNKEFYFFKVDDIKAQKYDTLFIYKFFAPESFEFIDINSNKRKHEIYNFITNYYSVDNNGNIINKKDKPIMKYNGKTCSNRIVAYTNKNYLFTFLDNKNNYYIPIEAFYDKPISCNLNGEDQHSGLEQNELHGIFVKCNSNQLTYFKARYPQYDSKLGTEICPVYARHNSIFNHAFIYKYDCQINSSYSYE